MQIKKFIIIFSIISCLLLIPLEVLPDQQNQQMVQGIYITQVTAQNTNSLTYLIQKSREVGINTFVIDLERPSPVYAKNIALVKQGGIRYVARIVIFPDGGGTAEEVQSSEYWEKKYSLVEQAIQFGADEIQLDYIRYNTQQPPSPQNAKNIYQIIKWFKNKLQEEKIPLEVDVFGISSFGPSLYIGQDVKVFADTVDALCPMVYPSHYEPYQKYAKMPYYIISQSLNALRAQFLGSIPFKVYPFIEVYNYRYPLSQTEKLQYIYKEIRAVEDTKMNGWYVWNIHNQYDNLFTVMEQMKNHPNELPKDIKESSDDNDNNEN